MSEMPDYETIDDKVKDIEHYLVKQVDTIRRLVLVAIIVSSAAVAVSVWGIVGQERVISIAQEIGAGGSDVSHASAPSGVSETTRSVPADAAPEVPPRPAGEAARGGSEAPPVASAPATTTEAAPEPARATKPATTPTTTPSPPPPARAITDAEAPEVGRFGVESSTIATEIVGLSPAGAGKRFPRSQSQLFCWSRIVTPELEAIPPADRVVTHRWRHEGEVVYERRITIGSPSYRVYSMVANPGDRPGSWEVDIVDAAGRIIGTERFVIE